MWAGGEDGVSFAGEFFSFQSLCSFPKPRHAKVLPIHVGGSSRAAARRAGRRGDGYFPGGRLTAQERAAQLEIMQAAAAEAGRDPHALDYTRWGSIGMSAADVEAHAIRGQARSRLNAGSDHCAAACPARKAGFRAAFRRDYRRCG